MIIGILNKDTMIFHGLKQCVSLDDLGYYDYNIFFSENLTYVHLSYSMSVDHIINDICNSRIENVILIGDNTTLLYGYQFMCSLHVVNNKS